MRSAGYVLAAALTFGVTGSAMAQTTPSSTATTQATTYGETVSHWVASGFVGGGFNASSDDPRIQENGGGVAYGGQVGYLWHGMVGPEFLFDWAPTFDVNALFLDGNANVVSYMFNAIGAVPLGADGQFQPFISGGFGAIQMAADVIDPIDNTTHNNSNAQWGTNLGGGVMAFAHNRVGLRGDVRYFHAFEDTNLHGSAADQLVEGLVSDISFWRATGGISFRW